MFQSSKLQDDFNTFWFKTFEITAIELRNPEMDTEEFSESNIQV